MKKTVLGLMALAISGMALTSCNMDSEHSYKDSFVTWNLITPLDGGAPDQCGSYYTLDMDLNTNMGTLATTLTYNKTNLLVNTEQTPVSTNGYSYTLNNFKGTVNSLPSMGLEDARIVITNNFVWPYGTFTDPDNSNNQFKLNSFYPNKENLAVGGTPVTGVMYRPTDYSVGGPVVLGNYRIGNDYYVRPFTCDCTYTGTTHTTYPGGSATNKTIYYRIVLDVPASKAYVVIYNAKFSDSDREPAKPVIYLPGLDITWANGTYSVNATNVVPKCIEDGKLVDYPSFTFANFSMTADGNWLQSALISYEVHNTTGANSVVYNGTFQGYFAVVNEIMPK